MKTIYGHCIVYLPVEIIFHSVNAVRPVAKRPLVEVAIQLLTNGLTYFQTWMHTVTFLQVKL